MTQKKRVDLGANNRLLNERFANIDPNISIDARGIAGDPIKEPIPLRITTSTEKVLKNGNGASVVLGRDRPRSRLSGYGGRGDTQAAMVDIVAGPQGFNISEFLPGNNRVWVDPDFEKDAARIYISQKTDIDDNFKLARGKVGNAKTKSGIGIKSDHVRIIAREGIKLITKTDRFNSQGGEVSSITGIDLIAGNDDSDLQPIVKGINLEEALKRMMHHMDKLNGIVDSLLMAQMTFNTALTSHFHFSPFFGMPTTPSPPVMAAGMKTMVDHLFQTKTSLIMHKTNMAMMKQTYFSPAGRRYINSRYNTSN